MKDKTFGDGLSSLAERALIINGVKYDYDDMDLFDATLIFFEVFSSKMYDYHKKKFPLDGLLKLSDEAGTSLRQTILLFTGVDMGKVFENTITGHEGDNNEDNSI